MLNCKSFAGITAAIIVALPSAVLVPTDGWAQIEEIGIYQKYDGFFGSKESKDDEG